MIIDEWTDLRHGRYQDVLADVGEVDAVIVDAPYSARTHGGHEYAVRDERMKHAAEKGWRFTTRRKIAYGGWTEDDVRECVDAWSERCRGWFVTITDHRLARVWERELDRVGRLVFAPIPWVALGSRIRLSGDGPSSWTCWIIVARPRSGTYRDGTPASRWGTLRGAYVITQDHGTVVVGAKPLRLMRALVRDYTRPGDLVVDPCAGGGTTLRACQIEGRRSVGAEMDGETWTKACERLRMPYERALPMDAPVATQAELFE